MSIAWGCCFWILRGTLGPWQALAISKPQDTGWLADSACRHPGQPSKLCTMYEAGWAWLSSPTARTSPARFFRQAMIGTLRPKLKGGSRLIAKFMPRLSVESKPRPGPWGIPPFSTAELIPGRWGC
ncbi:hypothetical protein GQ53DRAFT_425476 [Thozetella sp. PMI_491]|nr:hypothetical protein GQ53DRAFT_425476 [Thozetella sp. PMI_491]